MSVAVNKRAAMQWARKRIAALRSELTRTGERVWSEKAVANQIITEAERIWNIGAARTIAKTLKLERTFETEEETTAWEEGR